MNLIDLMEAGEPVDGVEAPRVEPRDCPHGDGKAWRPTTTVWPGETFERLTWTCADCGEIRGRA